MGQQVLCSPSALIFPVAPSSQPLNSLPAMGRWELCTVSKVCPNSARAPSCPPQPCLGVSCLFPEVLTSSSTTPPSNTLATSSWLALSSRNTEHLQERKQQPPPQEVSGRKHHDKRLPAPLNRGAPLRLESPAKYALPKREVPSALCTCSKARATLLLLFHLVLSLSSISWGKGGGSC